MTPLWTIFAVLFAELIAAFGALFFKISSKKFRIKFPTFQNKPLYIGFLFYAISAAIFIIALKYGELSVLYPLAATVYIWVAIFSKKFLNETLNTWKLLGIFAITLGVAIIGLSS